MTQLNGNTNQQPFEMGEDDLEKVRAMWNDVVVGASRDECEAADILVTLDADSPDIARVEIPATNESGREHRCLISLLSHGGTWRPLAPIHPGEIDQAVLNVSAGIDAVLENVDTMSVEAVRALLGEVNAKTMALANSLDDRNPRSTHPGWQPIPDDEPILAFWSQIPSDECLPS